MIHQNEYISNVRLHRSSRFRKAELLIQSKIEDSINKSIEKQSLDQNGCWKREYLLPRIEAVDLTPSSVGLVNFIELDELKNSVIEFGKNYGWDCVWEVITPPSGGNPLRRIHINPGNT